MAKCHMRKAKVPIIPLQLVTFIRYAYKCGRGRGSQTRSKPTLFAGKLSHIMTFSSLQEFKQTVTAVAEDIVFRVFPSKVWYICQSENANLSSFIDLVSLIFVS